MQLYNAITGFAVGDAIGVPYEFKKRNTFNCVGMRASTFKDAHLLLPRGSWSDDTSLMLCVLDALTVKRKYDVMELPPMTQEQIDARHSRIRRQVYKRFKYNALAWLFCGKYTNHWYHIPYDVGNSCFRGIMSMLLSLRNKRADAITANGNGGLMRILPLAFMQYSDDNELMDYIKLFNHCSHNHMISHVGCLIYIKLAQILQKEPENISKALSKAIKTIDEKYQIPEYQRIWDLSILYAEKNDVKSSGYVVDTLEAAIWCLAHAESYAQAVFAAVNLGGDTDTIAALTGGLSGIYHKNVPKTWVKYTRRRDFLHKMCTKLKGE